ncbi:MAG TPA: tail fiber protein [Vicinamibacterales bacterium]|jgi:microcystin-dependent protein
MTSTRFLLCSTAIAVVGLVRPAAADQPVRPGPLIGEIRAIAISGPSAQEVARLHEDGWLEARGQLLSTSEFPELFNTIGRAWTSDGVAENRFAVPDIERPSGARASNPFGVMGPGDLVAGGQATKSWSKRDALSYWIYAGRAVSSTPRGAEMSNRQRRQ